MSTGWVSVSRALRDDPLWTRERFSRGQAWIDLRLTADETTGEIVTSEGALAGRWRWTRPTVRTFLDGLVTGGFIALSTTAGVSQIRLTRPAAEPVPPARCVWCQSGLDSFELSYWVWNRAEQRGWLLCPLCLDRHRRDLDQANVEVVAWLDTVWRIEPSGNAGS